MNIKPAENYGANITQAIARDKVFQLESLLKTLPQVDCPVRNVFAPGIYAREITMQAGTVITGAVHRFQHITVISKGRLRVLRPEGIVEFAAPAMFISEPGTKNAVHVLEDAVWTTFHPNPDDSQDLDTLVERYTTSKNSDLLGHAMLASEENKKVEG